MQDFEIVFVGGAPRSATTLVQKMLNAHSEIYGGPEFDRLGDILHLRNLLQLTNSKGRSIAYYNSSQLDAKISDFIVSLLKEPAIENNARIICEKTPNNIFQLNDLLNTHQAAKGIIVIRDPRAIIASMKNVKSKALEAGEPVPGFTKSTSKSISFIKKYWQAGLKAVSNHRERVKIIIYEELIANTEIVLAELCEFLNISFEESMIKPGESDFDRASKTDNIWYKDSDHKRNIDTASLDKWKSVLSVSDKNLIENRLMDDYNSWKNENRGTELSFRINQKKGSKLRGTLVSWLRKNERIRGTLSRLIKDSYSKNH